MSIEQISQGLTELCNFVQNHAGHFELHDKQKPNHREFERLHWLAEALRNFIQRGTRLYFIGFLGHFSSGKSSTINSLCGRGIQLTGLHPTDNGITLITHPDNAPALEGLKTGRFASNELVVPINLKHCEQELFKRIVLMDTPGSGDVPGTVNAALLDEVVCEFLPLCDLLVYCFNATSMLDNADLRLLTKKQEQLPEAPMLFVISRADEFRRDPEQLFSAANYDGARAARDLTQLRSRVQAALTELVTTGPGFASRSGDGPGVHSSSGRAGPRR